MSENHSESEKLVLEGLPYSLAYRMIHKKVTATNYQMTNSTVGNGINQEVTHSLVCNFFVTIG